MKVEKVELISRQLGETKMDKNTMVKTLIKLRNGEIDLDESISILEEYDRTNDLINELDMLYEIDSEIEYKKKLEELIYDISNSQDARQITHKDLRDTKLIKESTIDSLNDVIRNILKDTK